MVGHMDTVFEPDSPFQKFTRDGNTAYGPGVADMKGGDVSMIYAMKALHDIGALKDMNLTNLSASLMLTPLFLYVRFLELILNNHVTI